MWVVVKESRSYNGGAGYGGFSLLKAGVKRGPYSTKAEAEAVADALAKVNPVGWKVLPHQIRNTLWDTPADS